MNQFHSCESALADSGSVGRTTPRAAENGRAGLTPQRQGHSYRLAGGWAMLTRVLDAATTRLVRYFGLSYDTFALVALQEFALGYVPWSQSAIRPSALVCVLNDIKVNRRRMIV